MQFLPYLIALAAVALILLTWFLRRGGDAPSVAVFQEIREAVLSLQQIAAGKISKAQPDGQIPGVSQAEMAQQVKRVGDAIRFVYTIDEDSNCLVHTISSQLVASKPEKFQVECMLVAMLTLNQQLEATGIDPKTVNFDVSRSEMGTHYLAMALSPEQHEALIRQRKVA